MGDETCTDCPDDEATLPTTGPDPRSGKITMWGPTLLAPIAKPTGDKRRFAAHSLTHRELPLPLTWQRERGQGHEGAVTIGTLHGIRYDEQGAPHGFGLIFEPDPEQLPRLAQDVAEAKMLLDQKVVGPSVDLDSMEFHALDPEEAGEYAADARPEIEVDKGRISAATLVPIPAFAEARPFPLSELDPDAWDKVLSDYATETATLTASVRADGWDRLPIAPADTEWSASEAVARLKERGDAELRRACLWSDGTDARFPLADVDPVTGALVLVPAAIEAAYAVLEAGTSILPEMDQAAMLSVLDELRDGEGWGDLPDAVEDMTDEEFADLGTALGDLDAAAEGDDLETFGARFDALVSKLQGHVANARAAAAAIGQHKYGKRGMAKLRAGVAAAKVKPLHGTVTASAGINVFRFNPDEPRVHGKWASVKGWLGAGEPTDKQFRRQLAREARTPARKMDLPSDSQYHRQLRREGSGFDRELGRRKLGPDGNMDPRFEGKTVKQAAREIVAGKHDDLPQKKLPWRSVDWLQRNMGDHPGNKWYKPPAGSHALEAMVAAALLDDWRGIQEYDMDALIASAASDAPPRAWFDDPGLTGPTPLTVTDDGRVFGHLATWKNCHIGFPGQCVTAPKSRTAYAYFHTGEVVTDGGPVSVGRVTIGTGHANTRHGFQAAVEHYDNTGRQAAVVRAGDDKFGIWVAGAALPGTDVAELRRSPLSGDWRRIGGNLELVGALAVNTPGFPIPRAMVASGEPLALVAAGAVGHGHVQYVGADGSTVDIPALVAATVAETRRQDAAEARRAAALGALAAIDDELAASQEADRRLRAARATTALRG